MRLATERLVLDPIAEEDARNLHALWTSPGVRRFLWDDDIIPMSQTEEVIVRSRQLFVERGAGLWGARLRDVGQDLCGFGALWPFRDPPEFELLYGVAEPHWGRGYATEIGRAVIGFCFHSLGMPSVRASTDAANTASTRVLEKLGFTFDRRSVVSGLDTVFYHLPRPQPVPGIQS